MNLTNRFTFIVFFCIFAFSGFAQNPFTNCTGAFLDNKIVVDDYSPTGKCVLSDSATGELTVCTANLSPTESIAVDKIKFKIAIRDKNTGRERMAKERWNRFAGTEGGGGRGL